MFYKYRIYLWYGIDYSGNECSGKLFAANAKAVKMMLRKKEVIVKKISVSRKYQEFFLEKPINIRDIAAFTKQISAILHTGVTYVQALKLATSHQNKSIFKELLEIIQQDIESGIGIAESFLAYKVVFGSFYCRARGKQGLDREADCAREFQIAVSDAWAYPSQRHGQRIQQGDFSGAELAVRRHPVQARHFQSNPGSN